MQPKLITFLEGVNQEIRGMVCKLSEKRGEVDSAVACPGELKALAGKLAQVPKWLDRLSPAQRGEEALQAAIGEYLQNLETLKGLLINLQESLGKRRDRLKKDFEHLNAARGWVETFRATHCN
jgi:hypothetical protein